MASIGSVLERLRASVRRDGVRATIRKSTGRIRRGLALAAGVGSPVGSSFEPAAAKTRDELARFIGLRSDAEYAAAQAVRREEVRGRLAGCAPENASPEEMDGYRSEAALRFWHTLAWVAEALAALRRTPPPLVLETGSNPYFLTILLKERFPQLRHMGLNYFGNPAEVGMVCEQGVVDPLGRLTRSRYLYADIERHSLQSLEPCDLCLFCEVLEHLPFDPGWALFNLVRQIRIGGRMILSTPNPARFENIARLVLRDGSTADPISGYGIHGRHNREYTVAELEDLLAGTGLSVRQARTVDVTPTEWSRFAEELGYGEYILIEAVVDRRVRIYRPRWLYRSFPSERLRLDTSLATQSSPG